MSLQPDLIKHFNLSISFSFQKNATDDVMLLRKNLLKIFYPGPTFYLFSFVFRHKSQYNWYFNTLLSLWSINNARKVSILNLVVQIGSGPGSNHILNSSFGSDHILKTGSGCNLIQKPGSDPILKTGFGSDHILKTGSGYDLISRTNPDPTGFWKPDPNPTLFPNPDPDPPLFWKLNRNRPSLVHVHILKTVYESYLIL